MSLLTRFAAFVTERQFQKDLSRLEAFNMTYKLMKRLIQKGLENGTLDREATMLKLDVFLMADRITAEEYQELVELMGGGGNE
jgi:hypothetical protein